MSHKTNSDGYFRKRLSSARKNMGDIEMFHRIIWKLNNGPIPEGYEINHLCKNRACQNVDHMECIPGSEHTIKTNQTRWL